MGDEWLLEEPPDEEVEDALLPLELWEDDTTTWPLPEEGAGDEYERPEPADGEYEREGVG